MQWASDGLALSRLSSWEQTLQSAEAEVEDDNPLRDCFEKHRDGPGIWKWNHYFEIYHRHLERFRNRPVNVLEIGIYSGGSLAMWRSYFGPTAMIHGIDIEPSCKAFENEWTRVRIGDQGDPEFWKAFKEEFPRIDVVIDDGSHRARQQSVTLEAMLPHLSPGGVYICEDLHGTRNRFAAFLHGLADGLNEASGLVNSPDDQERRLSIPATGLQAGVESICLYPFVAVITRNRRPVPEFVAPKRGTVWEPFLS